MDKTPSKLVGLDNYERRVEDEQKINDSFSIAFTAPTGIEVLKYLRSITLEAVAGPNVEPSHLQHLEGQRYIVGLIQRRINKGKSQQIVKDKQNERE
tara:strand:+ start:177 stop:467 length:291 start_codon:yes stop_codon:yes gene_type:complete